MTLYLIRGIPGSGKSTLAKSLGVSYVEADMFRMASGEYNFNRLFSDDAHMWVYYQAAYNLYAGDSVAVCSVFSKLSQMYRYFDLAEKYGADVRILEATEGSGVSIHNVPPYEMTRIKREWQQLPESWNIYKGELHGA